MNLYDWTITGLSQISTMPIGVLLLTKATLVLTVAWLLHFALVRANPRYRVLLWRGTMVSLVLLFGWSFAPPILEFDVPILETAKTTPALMTVDAEPTMIDISAPAAEVVPKDAPDLILTTENAFPVLTDVDSKSVHAADISHTTIPWQTVVFGVWGIGFNLLVIRMGLGYLRLQYLLKDSKLAPDSIVADARRIGSELGCYRHVEVRTSSRFAMPILCGMWRSVVVVPEKMCEQSFREQLPAILSHELTHARSWDVIWNAVIHVVRNVLWFHPLTWKIGTVHREACDAVCDAVSADYLGDVTAYCRTLAHVALKANDFQYVGALGMAQSCDVRRRVAALQRSVFAKPLRRRLIAGMSITGLVVASMLAGVQLTSAQRDSPNPSADSSEKPAQKNTPKKTIKPGFRPMKVRLLDPEGKPVVDAGVTMRANIAPYKPVRYRTNAEGIAMLEVPKHENMDLSLLFWAKQRLTVGAHWKGSVIQQPIPAEFTVTMQPGTTFGGVIRNEQGEPIAGADVTVGGSKQTEGNVRWWSINDTSKTDAQGKWRCNRMPADLSGFNVSVKVQHPDYVNIPGVNLKKLSVEELRDQTAAMVMHQGVVVEGIVTDPQGQPIAGARVGQFTESYSSSYTPATTNQNGHYRLSAGSPGEYTLVVSADSFVPSSRKVMVTADQREFDLQLSKGELIRLRVVDTKGQPIVGAKVSTIINQRALFLEKHDNYLTDANGRWSRSWIPEDTLTFYISKAGYGRVNKSFTPNAQEQVITLEAGNWTISGRVVDSKSQAPVTNFRFVEGTSSGSRIIWRKRLIVKDQSGSYQAAWNTSGNSRRVIRIEADGYLPSEARRLQENERQVTFDIELSKGQAVSGVILSQEGKPLADAEVALCTSNQGVYLQDGRPNQSQSKLTVRTKADGRFSFSPQSEAFSLLVMHDQGFAHVGGKQVHKEITIEAWPRVEGTLLIRNKPAADQLVTLSLDRPKQEFSTAIQYYYNATTDQDGKFAFKNVFPGSGGIHRRVVTYQGRLSSQIATHSVKSQFDAGEITQVKLSRNGRPVTGKFLMPDDIKDYDWNHARISLRGYIDPEIEPPMPPFPEGIDLEKDRKAAMEWWDEWKETAAGKEFQVKREAYTTNYQEKWSISYKTSINADGSFVFEDIPAYEYQLTVRAEEQPKGYLADSGPTIATLKHVFTVPEIPGGYTDQILDLGDLRLDKIQPEKAP